ncbi:MAG: hypothetical protein ABI541_09970 [Betaproteobacteria bacterium]
MKKFLIAAAAALALATVATTASAQHREGSQGGGSWRGGSSWQGGGSWHGGSHWGGWHGSRIGLSLGFGFPYYYWGPGYYPYAYAYPYPYGYYDGYSSYDDAAPQTYIQRDSGDAIAPPAPAQRSQYSYYCTNPAGYYPQIANCPSGWLTVVPNSAPRTAPPPR